MNWKTTKNKERAELHCRELSAEAQRITETTSPLEVYETSEGKIYMRGAFEGEYENFEEFNKDLKELFKEIYGKEV